MKVDYLIIPIDTQTSDALAIAMDKGGHEAVKRSSALAHLLNLKTLRRLEEPDLFSLRQGELLHHELGLFRERLQRIGQNDSEGGIDQLLADPLFTLTSPLWISTFKPEQVVVAHGGIDVIADELKRAFSEKDVDFFELARAVIAEIVSKLPMDCSCRILEVEPNQAPLLLDRNRHSDIKKEMDPSGLKNSSNSMQVVTQAHEILWALMDSRYNIHTSEHSIDFRDQYRELELKVLANSVKNISSKKENADAIEKMKSFGECHEPRVRPIGRRIRYAFHMLFSGKIKWKHSR